MVLVFMQEMLGAWQVLQDILISFYNQVRIRLCGNN